MESVLLSLFWFLLWTSGQNYPVKADKIHMASGPRCVRFWLKCGRPGIGSWPFDVGQIFCSMLSYLEPYPGQEGTMERLASWALVQSLLNSSLIGFMLIFNFIRSSCVYFRDPEFCVLVILGCHNKIPQTDQLEQLKFIFSWFERLKVQDQSQADEILVRVFLLAYRQFTFLCVFTWQGGGRKFSNISSYKNTNPGGSGPFPYDII